MFIKELPPNLKKLAIKNMIAYLLARNTNIDYNQALEYEVGDFSWVGSPEGSEFWANIYHTDIREEEIKDIERKTLKLKLKI